MKYIKTEKYSKDLLHEKIMGPNPLKIEEQLLDNNDIPKDAKVLDLGSGTGLTSVFLAKEYGFKVYAADLWSDPAENQKFFDEMGVSHTDLIPVKADATDLPFPKEFFDAIISTDSYNYFGRDETVLDQKILPFVKSNGYVYIAIPGMKKDCHDALPKELLLSWTPGQLDYMHDKSYWTHILSCSKDSKLISITEMEDNDEFWADWLECENEYAIGDRKSMNAGAGKYLNTLKIVIQKL